MIFALDSSFTSIGKSASALTFLECISRDIDALEVEVGIHRTEDGYHRRLSCRFPFAIYYTVETDVVQV
jgi:hypothetical protein